MKRGELDSRLLILVTLALVAFGLVMVYSATSASATVGGSDPIYYLKRQGTYAALGIVADDRSRSAGTTAACACSRRCSCSARSGCSSPCSSIGPAINGARRWISFGPGRLPAVRAGEARARDLGGRATSRASRRRATCASSGARSGALAAVFCVLLMLEPDMGTSIALLRDAHRRCSSSPGTPARVLGAALADRLARSAPPRSGSSRTAARASSRSCTRGTTRRAPASSSSRR